MEIGVSCKIVQYKTKFKIDLIVWKCFDDEPLAEGSECLK